jgi:hypothetical protein
MKKVIIFLVVIALLVGGAFWFLTGGALNDFIKVKIEEVGHQVTDQTVTVKSVDIKLLEGAGTINGIVLANPKEYSAKSAFSLNEVTLDINLESLTTDVIVIDKIVIDKPEAIVEFTQNGGSNIQDILDAIKKNLPTSDTDNKAASDKAKAEAIIKVNKFVLAGVALTVDLTKLGNKVHKKTLTDIKLTNIGGDAGLPASQLGAELLKQALSSIWKQAKKEQKNQIKDKLKDKIKEKLTDLFG